MIHFFCNSGIPQLCREGWNGAQWIKRALGRKPDIHVTNVDLLFLFDHREEYNIDNKEDNSLLIKEIEFTSPQKVGIKQKSWDRKLAPDEIEGIYKTFVY